MRWRSTLATFALLVACAKLPTKEKSSTPPEPEPTVNVQPDPAPYEGGMPFGDASRTPPFEAGCPDAMPEAGADCDDWRLSFDCPYVEDGGELLCTCHAIPEGTWWTCEP